jgi:hypothetical protein
MVGEAEVSREKQLPDVGLKRCLAPSSILPGDST